MKGQPDRSLLRVEQLCVEIVGEGPPKSILDRVSFDIAAGEIFCVVGESGCGKTLAALAIAGLLPPAARASGGKVMFRDMDLLAMPEPAMRGVRGGEIAMIFQEPMSSLNPVQKVGAQVAEVLRLHGGIARSLVRERVEELFREVGIPEPGRRLDAYPHELSGGLRQRVMIAMALAGEPRLLIADEPTTALDVTIQAQVLELLAGLCERRGLALLLISHDLGVVSELGRRICVLYAGQVVEIAGSQEFFAGPHHPYSRGLLAALPSVHGVTRPLPALPGTVPAAGAMPAGCRFRERCASAVAACVEEQELSALPGGRVLRCGVEAGS